MRTIALPKHKTLTASLEQCLQNRRSCREILNFPKNLHSNTGTGDYFPKKVISS